MQGVKASKPGSDRGLEDRPFQSFVYLPELRFLKYKRFGARQQHALGGMSPQVHAHGDAPTVVAQHVFHPPVRKDVGDVVCSERDPGSPTVFKPGLTRNAGKTLSSTR